jgi:hypothetical protein
MRPIVIVVAALCAIQILGIVGAVIAAAIDIESIVGSGVIFSLLGLFVAAGSGTSRSRSMLVFGLSAVAISLFLLVLINVMEWGQAEAAFPVTLILLGYELALAPVGLVALYHSLAGPIAGDRQRWRQFSVRSLLGLTLLAAIDLGVVRLTYSNHNRLLSVAVGFAVAAILAVGIVGFAALRTRRINARPLPAAAARTGSR